MGDLTKRTVKNSIFSVLEFAWPVILALLATPFIVSKLGADAYGVLSIVSIVLGFLAIMDLGLTTASIKYIAEEYEKGDIKGINKIINSTLLVYIFMGTVGGLLIFFFSDFLVVNILKMPVQLIETSKFAFHIAAIGLLVNMILGVFASIPRSLQRIDISTKVTILMGTLTTTSMVILLYFNYSLKEIVLFNLLISVVSLVIYYLITKKLIREYRFSFSFDKRMFTKLFKFGSMYIFAAVSGMLVFHFDKLVVGSVLGVSVVTYYIIPGNLTTKIQAFISSVVNIAFPVTSALVVKNRYDKIKKLYLRGSKAIISLTTMITVPIIIFANKFLFYWLSPEFAQKSTAVMIILAITYYLLSINGIGWNINYGFGKAKMNAILSWLSAILNIAFLLVLIKPFGIVGVAWAYLITVLITTPLGVFLIERKTLKMSGFEFPKIFLKILFVGILQGLISYFVLLNIAHSLIITIILMVTSAVLFIPLYIILGNFDDDDRQLVGLLFSKIKRK